MLYDRPVRELLAEAVASLPLSFYRDDLYRWFTEHYPKVKRTTLNAHLISATVNDRSRRHHAAFADLVFRTPDRTYERYDTAEHGQWTSEGEPTDAVASRHDGADRGSEPRVSGGREINLEPTGELVAASVTFGWFRAGEVSIDNKRKLDFPPVPPAPGVYRLNLLTADGAPEAVYVGQSDNLRRRMMRNYRNPGSRQRTSQRVNRFLHEHLNRGGRVTLFVTTDVGVEIRGDHATLDLSRKPYRVLAESAAWAQEAILSNVRVENLE